MQKLISVIKRVFLFLSIPFQILLQRLGRQESLITKNAVDTIMKLAEPGDIIVCSEQGRPTSKLIKGDYDHAAIIPDNVLKVIDAVGDKYEMRMTPTGMKKVNIGGVRINDIEKWLYQLKMVALIRPEIPVVNGNFKASVISNGQVGKGYDYLFDTGDNEKIYCSELPYYCYKLVYPSFLWYHKGDEILPQYYRDMCNEKSHHFKLIFEFKGEE